MRMTRRLTLGLCIGLATGGAALAAATVPSRVRGDIASVDAHSLVVTTRKGDTITLGLPDDARVALLVPIALDAIKPGSFIGTAARTLPDGTIQALEVHVFPESMRGTGEGHRPWDLGTDTTMTNGTVGKLDKVSDGRTLTVGYHGGEKQIVVPASAPIVTYEPGDRAALKPGAHVIVFTGEGPDGQPQATRITVGKDGLVPPM